MTPLSDLLAANPLEVPSGDKGERGTLAVVGGPATCPGAAILAAEAALRTGSGRVKLVVAPEVAAAVGAAVPETLVVAWDLASIPMPADALHQLEHADALVLGPGYRDGVRDGALMAAEATGVPLVLDAAALDAAPYLLQRPSLVLAPNAQEAARVTDADGSEAELATRLVDLVSGPVAVRGRRTVVAAPGGGAWDTVGPDGLGGPGSGDVLMGILGALLARGLPALAALGWAVGLHERAATICARTSPVGYVARDIARNLPLAYRELSPGR